MAELGGQGWHSGWWESKGKAQRSWLVPADQGRVMQIAPVQRVCCGLNAAIRSPSSSWCTGTAPLLPPQSKSLSSQADLCSG